MRVLVFISISTCVSFMTFVGHLKDTSFITPQYQEKYLKLIISTHYIQFAPYSIFVNSNFLLTFLARHIPYLFIFLTFNKISLHYLISSSTPAQRYPGSPHS